MLMIKDSSLDIWRWWCPEIRTENTAYLWETW